jgi:hypothetical protein
MSGNRNITGEENIGLLWNFTLSKHPVIYPANVSFLQQGETSEFLRLCLFLLFVSCGGVKLNPLGTSATLLPIASAPDDR